MEVEEGQDRVQLGEERVQRVCERARLRQRLLQPRHRPAAHRNRRVEVAEQVLEVGREVAEVVKRGPEVVRGALQVVHERIRVPREVLEPRHRRLALVEEGREDRERLAKGLVARGGGLEHALRVHDQLTQGAAALVDRAEHPPGVLDQVVHGDVLLVEHLHQLRAVHGEALEVAERVAQVLASVTLRDRAVQLLDPVLERLTRLWVECREDLVELGGALDPRVRQPATVRQHAGAPVPRRQLDVGLAEQRLLAQDRVGVLRDRRVRRVQLDLHDRARAALVELLRLHLADVHAGHPHVGLLGERRGLRHVHGEPVALGLQRHRAAEREPQEDQDREHREREGHHRDHPAEAGGLLDHGAEHAPSAPKRCVEPVDLRVAHAGLARARGERARSSG